MEQTIANGMIFIGGLRQFPTNHEYFEAFCFEESRIITVDVDSSLMVHLMRRKEFGTLGLRRPNLA